MLADSVLQLGSRHLLWCFLRILLCSHTDNYDGFGVGVGSGFCLSP